MAEWRKFFQESLWHRIPLLYAGIILSIASLGNHYFHWLPRHLHSAATPLSEPTQPTSLTQISSDNFNENPWPLFHPSWALRKKISLLSTKDDDWEAKLRSLGQQIEELVDDPKNRIEPEFKVAPNLRQRVVFWMEIYARFNSRIRVVHDRENPSIIYGYIDFRPIYRNAESILAGDIQANRLEKKIIKGIKIRIEEAVGLEKSEVLSPEEKSEVQAFLSHLGAFSSDGVQKLVENIRTQSGQSDNFLLAIYRSRNLLPHIESVFRKKGLPVALARIPFVESSFNAKAESKGGAIGIWQFMPETAKQMIPGNEETAWSDPLRQTESAARIITLYRGLLPDWGTTVTAYNSGVGRLQRLVKKYHLHGISGLFDISGPDALGFAGKNFFAELLAANLVEAYREELFKHWLEPADSALVFKGTQPFPKNYCDM